MRLRTLMEQWDRLARGDPFWAVLTDPSKRNGGWDVPEFFDTGVQEISAAMKTAELLGHPAQYHTALDFGCGVGRLTRPLATFFDQVTGVDVSPVMLDLARQLNQAGERCVYVLNTKKDVRQFADGTFDFVYSRNVLQHVGTRNARRYVAEFVRILRPSGLALFQLPSRLRSASVVSRVGYRANRLGRQLLGEPRFIYMSGVPREILVADLQKQGAVLLKVVEDESAGPEWISYLYAITK